MKKTTKIILGAAVVFALLGLCFVCLSVYAKKEINKPRFELPTLEAEQTAPLPTTKEEAFDYVSRLYSAAASADDIEMSTHTDVHTTNGEKVLPFSSADNAAISRILEKAQGELGTLYPVCGGILISESEDFPQLGFSKADVVDFTAVKGGKDDKGEPVDEEYFFITLTVNPGSTDTNAMLHGERRGRIEKELSSILKVSSLDIEPDSFTASFKIRFSDDMLTHIEFRRNVKIKASVDFTDAAYQALSKETVQLEFPYETVQSIDLFYYGIHFTESRIAVRKNDMQALPLEVNINSQASKQDCRLTFDVSEDGLLEIDDDGVVTVTAAQEEPVTVTAKLEYKGHTYTDELIVYTTELEVKTDEPAKD